MLKILLAALVLVGLCVFGLCFNIIFRKNGHFPETDVGSNREMRKRGIVCAKEDELKMWRKKDERAAGCDDSSCAECTGCDVIYGQKEDSTEKE